MDINQENWTYTHYKAKELKAFISFGASADILDDQFIYYATVTDSEHNDVLQEEFPTINAACDFLNKKYSNLWDFIDARVSKKDGGCSSCVAH